MTLRNVGCLVGLLSLACKLGHVFGFGNSLAFDSFVSGTTFIGPNAVAVFGAPPPLEPDASHFVNRTLFEGGEMLMDSGHPNGGRTLPTRLDLAVLADIGFEID